MKIRLLIPDVRNAHLKKQVSSSKVCVAVAGALKAPALYEKPAELIFLSILFICVLAL